MSLPSSYRAWTWHDGDSALALALADVANAPLARGQVLVRNEVIGLNPVDWKVLGSAEMGWSPGKVPGVDGAGIVVALGEQVPARWLGQRVAYHQHLAAPGSFAHYTPIAARALLRVPDALDMQSAASFPCPGLTAWQALEKLPLPRGQSLLVSGAGGAVGHYLVQLASARGLDVTTLSHPRHWDRLRALGAVHCMAGPLADGQSWPADAPRYAAVVDSVNAEHAARLAPALRANGHLVCIQGRVAQWPCAPFGRALSLHEVALGPLHRYGDDADWAQLSAAGERLLQDLAQGRLQAESRVVRGFDELPQLLHELRHRQFSGKPLIALG